MLFNFNLLGFYMEVLKRSTLPHPDLPPLAACAFLLRRRRSFGVQEALLKTFYDSVVASAIFYGAVCWSSGLSVAERKRLDQLIRKASSDWMPSGLSVGGGKQTDPH